PLAAYMGTAAHAADAGAVTQAESAHWPPRAHPVGVRVIGRSADGYCGRREWVPDSDLISPPAHDLLSEATPRSTCTSAPASTSRPFRQRQPPGWRYPAFPQPR